MDRERGDALLPGSSEAGGCDDREVLRLDGGRIFRYGCRARGNLTLGALTARRKPLQDSPTPAGNPTAAAALLRLEELSGRKEYREIAEDTLESFAGIVEHFGLYAGSYGLALERLVLDPVQVVMVGDGPEADELESLAMARFAVNKMVIRMSPQQMVAGRASRSAGGDSAAGSQARRASEPGLGLPWADVHAAGNGCGGSAAGARIEGGGMFIRR